MALSSAQDKFLDWLLTPKKDREPSTQKELAEVLLVHEADLSHWKKEKPFLEEWERRYLATIGNPDRKQTIMDTLYRTATDPDDPKHVQAAKQYFEIEGSLKPAKTEVNIQTGDASGLSKEQLERLLAMHAERHLKAVGE